MFNEEQREIVKRIQRARIGLMQTQPFYALLLMHMIVSIDPACETAYTDGKRIAFCPDFLRTLSDGELEFILMHEVLHAALGHCRRMRDSYDFDDFNIACDIVVNANILHDCDMDLDAITLKDYGVSMYLAPNGRPGYRYTAEEVYEMLRLGKTATVQDAKRRGAAPSGAGIAARDDGGFDDHTFWMTVDESEDGGGDGNGNGDGNGDGNGNGNGNGNGGDGGDADQWLHRMIEAAQIAEMMISVRDAASLKGKTPLLAQRLLKEYTRPKTDWRTLLNTFVQEEITDYSFDPPDRRFQDSPFLLPDYNQKDESVRDILFMIDTSASMTDEMITQAYSEILGAIRQFNGRLQGLLGFFDAEVVEPKPFQDEEEMKIIRPAGGGGTNFHCIFEYVREHERELNVTCIIILTDGYADFPDEEDAMNIPVLWMINNEEVEPPWGKTARI